MEEQAKDGGRETEEEPPRKKNKEAQQNVNVTGVTGGSVDTAYTAGIVYGGMGNKIVTEPDHQKKLLKRTKEEIEVMTAGMIRVSAVEEVINKMNKGQHWITITGNAGDGKTTLGYLVLKQFLEKKVKVFTIYKPEEYDHIADMEEDRVIMFDDRFGAFLADHQLIKSWRDVIQNILRLSKRDKPTTKVLFISRKNVLKESKVYLEHFTDDIFNKDCVLDLSKRNLTDERLMILEYHLGCEKVTIPLDLKHRVCSMQIAHGFPHCCKMFSKLKSKGYDVDIQEFFESPLKFLDMTTRVLYYDNCRNLFQLMIKNDGQLDVYNTIQDEVERQALLKVEKEQEGSYITVWINGICKFAHPSVYESVLNVINDIDPLYCVQYATLSVIRQKMFISTSEEEDRKRDPCYIIVKPYPDVLKVLAKRFLEEILEGNYSVFGDELCQDRRFCEALVSCLVNTHQGENSSTLVINKRDKDGETMLWTALKSGNIAAVCTLMSAGACVHEEHDTYGKTPLHYNCREYNFTTDRNCDKTLGVIDIIITEGGGDVNICDKYGRKPLHYLLGHQDICSKAIQYMVSVGKSNVNLGDSHGSTPLHYLCSRRNISADLLKVMITEGKGNLNQCEQYMSTPLHYLCSYSDIQMDTADLAIREGKGNFNKGDEHGTTPLHYLCDNRKVEFGVIRRLVNTAKGDINKQDDNGITPLHVICKGSHQIKDILPLIHQEDKTDMYGNTPLHFLCRRRGINAEEVQQQLKQIPEADMMKQNSLGYTPWDYLNDQDDHLTWRDGMIDRSPADLVMCRFLQGDKWIVVKAPAMTLNSERVHSDLQVEDFSRELNNMARSGDRDRPGQFRRFNGTCSSPVPVPPSPSPFSLPTYWETDSRHTREEEVGYLLQMGVVEGEDHLDEQLWVSLLPGSVCVAVVDDCPRHDDHLCIQVLRRDQEYRRDQVGECVTLPLPTPGEEFIFKFGLVLDVGRGRVGFIDVERGEILGKVDRKFTEWVFPMFYVAPFDRPTRMRLVSGREISINDRKIQLIQQVLSD